VLGIVWFLVKEGDVGGFGEQGVQGRQDRSVRYSTGGTQ
jgi:hypothetical protein